MTKDLSAKIVEKIKKEEIKPLPVWDIFFRRAVFWLLFVSSSVFGGVVLALILFHLKFSDLEFYPFFEDNFITFILKSFPYFWLVLYVSFCAFAYWFLRHTREGYRWGVMAILMANLLITILVGVAFYSLGLPEKMDRLIDKRIGFYHGIEDVRQLRWNDVERGVLAGVVIDFEGQILILEDFGGERWRVLSVGPKRDFVVKFVKGDKVKMLGRVMEKNEFEAVFIDYWHTLAPFEKEELKILKENFRGRRIK